jgi:hypothetical protein
MKEKLRTLAIALMVSVMLTFARHTTVVGKGAQGATATTNGIIMSFGDWHIGVSDPSVSWWNEDYTVLPGIPL